MSSRKTAKPLIATIRTQAAHAAVGADDNGKRERRARKTFNKSFYGGLKY